MRRNFVCTLRIRLAFLFYFLECYFLKNTEKRCVVVVVTETVILGQDDKIHVSSSLKKMTNFGQSWRYSRNCKNNRTCVLYRECISFCVKIHVIVFESYGYYSVYMFLNVFLFELIRKIIEKAQIGGGCVVLGSKNLEILNSNKKKKEF